MVPRNKFTKQILHGSLVTPSLQDIGNFFRTSIQSWEASESYRQLRSTFVPIDIPQDINKIVAFACGSISTSQTDPLTSRSMFQHALILTLHDIFCHKEGNSKDIVCYAQDPAYIDADKSILTDAGITIVDDPEAFLITDESTAVISCSPDVPVKQIISDITQPSIMVWNLIRGEPQLVGEEEATSTDPDTPRLQQMVDNYYEHFEFPDDPDHFGDLAIYVRSATKLSEV